MTLRAKVGPLARNKRLRMVRVDSVAPVSVRFERSETDGRNHSQWVMSSDVAPADIGSELTMRLVYQGQFWDGLLDTVLGGVIDDAVPGLKAYADR